MRKPYPRTQPDTREGGGNHVQPPQTLDGTNREHMDKYSPPRGLRGVEGSMPQAKSFTAQGCGGGIRTDAPTTAWKPTRHPSMQAESPRRRRSEEPTSELQSR